MRNYVTMSFYNEKTTMLQTAAYEFKPYGRFAFVQKMLWKLLLKMNVLKQYWDPQLNVKRVNINTKDFSKRLLEYYNRSFPDRVRPSKVYMGPKEFDRLAHLSYKDQYSIFTFNVEMGYNGKLFNLPITVIPHMNGVLIV